MTCTATYQTVTARCGPAHQPRQCTGSRPPAAWTPATDQLTVTVNAAPPAPAPALTLKKTSDKDTYVVGDTITYTYTVTNTGNVTINDMLVTDDKLGTPPPARPLASHSGDSMTCTATYQTVTADVGQLTNHASCRPALRPPAAWTPATD